MAEDNGLPEREVKDFKFQQLCRFRISQSPSSLPKGNIQLVAASSNYGLCFVGFDKGFKVLKTAELSKIDEVNAKDRTKVIIETKDKPELLWTEVQVKGSVMFITLNADETTLGVVVQEGSNVFGYMYDVRAFAAKGRQPTPFLHVRLNRTDSDQVIDISWNPVQENILAVVLSSGSVHLYGITEHLVIIASSSAEEGATCVCWSPKGKQLVVGRQDGKLAQFDQQLTKKREWQCPDNLPTARYKVVGVSWLSTYNFLAAYTLEGSDPSDQPFVLLTYGSKDKPPSFVNCEDVCFGNGEDRVKGYTFKFIQSWDMVIASSCTACETAVLGKHMENKELWERWNLDDAARAELPLTDDHTDTYPMGFAIDFSSQYPIPLGDTSAHPPSPILLLLSTDGVLVPYYMMYSNSAAPGITKAPKVLSSEGARQGNVDLVSDANAVPGASITTGISDPAKAIPSGPPSGMFGVPQSTAAQPTGMSFAFVGNKSTTLTAPTATLGNPLSAGRPETSFSFTTPVTSQTTSGASVTSGFGFKGIGASQGPSFNFTTTSTAASGFGLSQNTTQPVSAALGGQNNVAKNNFAPGASFGLTSTTTASPVSAASAAPKAFNFAKGTPDSTTLPPPASTAGGAVGVTIQPRVGGTTVEPTSKPASAFVGFVTTQTTGSTSSPGQNSGGFKGFLSPAQTNPTASAVKQPAAPVAAFRLPSISQSQPPAYRPPAVVDQSQPPAYRPPPATIQSQPPAYRPPAATNQSKLPAYRPPAMTSQSQSNLVRPMIPANQTQASIRPVGIPVIPASTVGSGPSFASSATPIPAEGDDTFVRSTFDEIAHFEQEIKEFQSRAKQVMSAVGTRQEMLELKALSVDMINFCTEVKNTTKDQCKEVEDQKSVCLDMFAMVQECRVRDERNVDQNYHHLLKSRALDPASLDRLRQLQQQYQVVDQGTRDVDHILDQQWDEYQNSKKNKARLKVPSTDMLYRALKTNCNLITVQKDELNKIEAKLKQLRLYNKKTLWQTPTRDSNRTELSTLADSLLESAEDTSDVRNSTMIGSTTSDPKPRKQAKLREFLSRRSVPLVKSTKPKNLSLSRIASTRPIHLPEQELSPLVQPSSTQEPQPRPTVQASRGRKSTKPPGQTFDQPGQPAGGLSGLSQQTGSFSGTQKPGLTVVGPQMGVFSGVGQKVGFIGGPQTGLRLGGPNVGMFSGNPVMGVPQLPRFPSDQKPLTVPQPSSGKPVKLLEDVTPPSSTGSEEDKEYDEDDDEDDDDDDEDEDDDDYPDDDDENEIGFGPQYSQPSLDSLDSEAEVTGFNVSTPKTAGQSAGVGFSRNLFGQPAASTGQSQSTAGSKGGFPAMTKKTDNGGSTSAASSTPSSGFNFSGGGASFSFGGNDPKPNSTFSFGAAQSAGSFSFGNATNTTTTTTITTATSTSAETTKSAFGVGTTTSVSFANKGTVSSSISTAIDKTGTVEASPILLKALSVEDSEEDEGQKTLTKASSPAGQNTSKTVSPTVAGFNFSLKTETPANPVKTEATTAPSAGDLFSTNQSAPTADNALRTLLTQTPGENTKATPSSTASFASQPNNTNTTTLGGNVATTSVGLFGSASKLSTSNTGGLFGKTSASPAGSTGNAATTAATSAQGGIISLNSSSTAAAGTSMGLFGKVTTPSSGAVFTTPSATTSAGSLFGQSVSSTSAVGFSAFGSTTTASTGSVFGQPSSSSTTASKGNVFGQPSSSSPAATSSTGSVFGHPSSSSTAATSSTGSVLGQPTDSSTTTTTASTGRVFGQPTASSTTTSAATTGGLFGQPTASPTTTSAGTTGGLFGQPTASSTTTSTGTTGGLFGQPTASSTTTSAGTTGGLFGQPAASTAATPGLFGTTQQTGFDGGSSASGFGTTSTSTAAKPLFGGNAATSTSGTSVFGGTAANSTASTPLFGGTATTSAASMPLFGGTAATSTASTPLFAAPATTSQSVFGSTPAAPAPLFGSTVATTSQSVFGGATTAVQSVFGTTPASSAAKPLFGGTTAATTSAPAFGSTAGGFGNFSKPTFGQSSFGQQSSVFGQPQTSDSTSSGGTGLLFSGLGGQPSAEKANTNVFGTSQPFGSGATSSTATLFGGNTSSPAFGSAGSGQSTGGPFTGGGSFSGGGVGSTGFAVSSQQSASGFGAAPSFGGSPGFGGGVASTGFGQSPTFGSGAGFGGGASFSSPIGGSSGSGFAGFASSNSPTFGSIASNDGQTFGNLGQNSPQSGGFAQAASQGTGFGQLANQASPVFGGQGGFGGSPSFGGNQPGFGGGSNPAFTGYRS